MEGSEIVVKDLAIGCHNFRIVTGNEERNCIAIPLNSALIVGFVGDVSSVIRRIEQQPVFEPLLLDALVNSLNKLVGLEEGVSGFLCLGRLFQG